MSRARQLVLIVPAVFALMNLVLAVVAVANGPCIPQSGGGC